MSDTVTFFLLGLCVGAFCACCCWSFVHEKGRCELFASVMAMLGVAQAAACIRAKIGTPTNPEEAAVLEYGAPLLDAEFEKHVSALPASAQPAAREFVAALFGAAGGQPQGAAPTDAVPGG